MQEIIVESERLIILPRTETEMISLYENEADPEMKRAYSEMIAIMRNGSAEWGSDWKICRKDGIEVGGIGFKGEPDKNGCVELGYGIKPEHQRQGYATEAVGAMVRWAHKQPGIVSVRAQTEPDNAVSQRVLRKNGFVCIGTGVEGPMFEVRKYMSDSVRN